MSAPPAGGAGAPPGWLGHARTHHVTCTSTSDLALAAARAGAAHGTVITAGAQTAGRGRLGRAWASPPGASVYLSAVIRAARPLAELAPLTLAIGVGVVDAARAAGVAATLKWPNDVLVGERKLAGVLCEVAGDGCVVAGIGVNVNAGRDAWPPEVAARATSLALELGHPVDFARFTDQLLAAVEPWIDRLLTGGVPAIAAAWEARMTPGLRLRVERGAAQGAVTGTALGLDRDGALRLRGDDGVIHRIVAGDVALADPPAPQPRADR